MSRFLAGNLFLLVSMLCATASHVLLKGLLDQVQPTALSWSTIEQFLVPARLLRLSVAGVLLVTGFVTWMACLTKLSLSYAYPVASTSVLLISVFSIVVLGESMTGKMWVGTVLILAGIVLLRPVN